MHAHMPPHAQLGLSIPPTSVSSSSAAFSSSSAGGMAETGPGNPRRWRLGRAAGCSCASRAVGALNSAMHAHRPRGAQHPTHTIRLIQRRW